VVSTEACAEFPGLRRLLQHGVHAERGSAYLFGGLGNVAGDQLKATSDLGVPVVGVGLLYQQGYFRQVIDRTEPNRRFPYNDPDSFLSRLCVRRMASGCDWKSHCPGTQSGCGLQVQVGRVRLYCWTAMIGKLSRSSGITSELYGGGRSCASSKKCSSGSADGDCLPRLASSQRSVT